MKAVTVSQFGGPEVLTVDDLPVPEPGPGEVLVQTQAAGVGPWDTKMRGGGRPRPLPYVPGAELSGLVALVGAGVDAWAVGTAVISYPALTGCYAEYVVVPEDRLAVAPASVNAILAAGLPVCGVTALQGVVEELDVTAGQTVLITGAAGGVGGMAVQLAGSRGARVIGTAGPENHGYLERLGAAVAVDYHEPDWVEAVRKEAPDGVDAVFDCVGGATLPESFGALRDAGRAVTIVARDDQLEAPRGISWKIFYSAGTTARLTAAARLVDEGAITIDVTRTFRLGEAAQAHAAVETGHTRGKVVLIVDPSVE
jgi:NADPH:quinone reductase-like Zn-dependent oxidoreductase